MVMIGSDLSVGSEADQTRGSPPSTPSEMPVVKVLVSSKMTADSIVMESPLPDRTRQLPSGRDD
jgi:hypothetical protein